MKLFLLFILAFNLVAHAEDDYLFRMAYGKATASTLGEVLVADIKASQYDFRVFALDGGYLLKRKAFEWPMDVYVKAGLSHFDDSAYALASSSSIYEATLYIKAYWNFDFLENRVRVGLGEGGSYTTDILSIEYLEDPTSKKSYFLNYIDLSADFDLGRLFHYKPLYDTYVGWALKHRSGIYGLINGVTKGGSNYNTLYLEKSF